MYMQTETGEHNIFEQDQVIEILKDQPGENPDQIDLDEVISMMDNTKTVNIEE
jgi:hypothetical protein